MIPFEIVLIILYLFKELRSLQSVQRCVLETLSAGQGRESSVEGLLIKNHHILAYAELDLLIESPVLTVMKLNDEHYLPATHSH
jgi:hypothetical protein